MSMLFVCLRRLTFVTTGILLRMLTSDNALEGVSQIIIDEVRLTYQDEHERCNVARQYSIMSPASVVLTLHANGVGARAIGRH